jgi:chaperonin GroES
MNSGMMLDQAAMPSPEGQQLPGTSPMGMPPMAPPMPPQEPSEDIEIQAAAMNTNIAEDLEEDELRRIGMDAKREYDTDEASRKDWLSDTQDWLDLAMQIRENKTFPWPDASNIKYPLIATASLQFNARAYPTLVPGDGKLVKTRIFGKDPGGQKAAKGDRVATYMSWQFMHDMETWDEDMDRMFMMLPVAGMVFKKTHYCPIADKVLSKLVFAENFVVDYYTHTLEEAERYSEIIHMPERLLKARQRNGDFLDKDLGPAPQPEVPIGKTAPTGGLDKSTPYKIIEQHRWEDLDDDGVMEPYIVTFHYQTGTVLRISPNFTPQDMKMDGDEVVSIKRNTEFYTKYGFIPNPDGSFYDLGFGHLLGPINEAVNTLVNQLVDSGTLHNLQSGFIGKGLKMKMGDAAIQPGEWKAVNATGDDLRKQIVPLPTKEPSTVLFQLLGMLVTSGKELASVAEIFVGKMPGQNTPATTTMASIEQGMKVFTAIYKRVYRSMAKEMKKVYKLNGMYMDPQTYSALLDEPVGPEDFQDSSYDVCPTADPVATTQQEKLLKAQALMELLPSGLIDPMQVVIRNLQAQEQPDWEKLIPGMAETGQPQPPQQKPDPKMMEMQAKQKLNEQEHAQRSKEMQEKHAMEMQSQQGKLAMEQQRNADKREHEATMAKIKAGQAIQAQKIFMAEKGTDIQLKGAEKVQNLQHKKAEGQEKLAQQREQGEAKLQQMKAQSKIKSSSSNGGTAPKGKSSKK